MDSCCSKHEVQCSVHCSKKVHRTSLPQKVFIIWHLEISQVVDNSGTFLLILIMERRRLQKLDHLIKLFLLILLVRVESTKVGEVITKTWLLWDTITVDNIGKIRKQLRNSSQKQHQIFKGHYIVLDWNQKIVHTLSLLLYPILEVGIGSCRLSLGLLWLLLARMF